MKRLGCDGLKKRSRQDATSACGAESPHAEKVSPHAEQGLRTRRSMVAESVSFSCTVPAPEHECGSGSEIRTRIRFRLLTRNSGPVPAPE